MAQTLKNLPAHANSHLGYSMTPVLSAQPPITTTRQSQASACTVTTPSQWSRASVWSPTGTTTPPSGIRPWLAPHTTPPSSCGLQLVLSPHLPGGRTSRHGLPLAQPHLPAVTGFGFGLHCYHTFPAVARFGVVCHWYHYTSQRQQAQACPPTTPHHPAVGGFGLHCHHTFAVVMLISVVSHQHHYTSRQRQAQACAPATPQHPAVAGFGLRPPPLGSSRLRLAPHTTPPGGRGLRLALSPHLPGGHALQRGLPPAPLHLRVAAGPGFRSRHTTPPGGHRLRLAPHTTPSWWSRASVCTSTGTTPTGGRTLRLAVPHTLFLLFLLLR